MPFDGVLAAHGYERVDQDRDLDRPDDDYETLRGFLRVRRAELTLVAHSHGGQVLAYSLAGMQAPVCPIRVVTVDIPTPMRLAASHDASRIIRRPIKQIRAQDRRRAPAGRGVRGGARTGRARARSRAVAAGNGARRDRDCRRPWPQPGAHPPASSRPIDETRLVIDELGNVRLAEVVAELREVEMRLSD